MRRRELLSGGKPLILTLSKSSESVSWSAGTAYFNVLVDGTKYTSTTDVNVTSSNSFATPRNNAGTVAVSYTKVSSNTITSRSATIYVSFKGQTKTFILTQQGYVGSNYVDLGLPSGLKWAKWNVGASSETDYGKYYLFGRTSEFTAGATGYTGSTSSTGYSTISTSYDVARYKLGSPWRLPTYSEVLELATKTTTAITTINSVKGVKFTSKSNDGYIFLPFSGEQYTDCNDQTKIVTNYVGTNYYLILTASIYNNRSPVYVSAYNNKLTTNYKTPGGCPIPLGEAMNARGVRT